MFEEIFLRLYERNKDIKVIGVWGKDGLELEKKWFTDNSDLKRSIDLDISGAELADVIARMDHAKTGLDTFLILADFHGYKLMVYSLTKDYFLILLTENTILEGKLRFYLGLYRNHFTDML
ncbi:MAG: hypothetical protein ACM3SY_08550 [Candidatus Omnitrophota bacterium]